MLSTVVFGLAACGEAATAPNGNEEGDDESTNTAPVAAIAADDQACVSVVTELDGTGSRDADGDDLSYTWSFVSTPSGSAVTLVGGETSSAEFTPDVAGTYTVELQVSDGTDDATSTATLEAIGNQITDDIAADTTFTAVCPVYHVDMGLSVDAALTIEPGVTFLFTEGFNHRLIIRDGGSIAAIGTATDTIRFLSDAAAPGAWEGIEIRSDSPLNELTYVEVAYGGLSSAYHNVRVNGGAQLRITNSLIRDSGQHGLQVGNGAVLSEFSANSFRDNTLAPLNIPPDQIGALDGASTYEGGNGLERIEVRGGDVEAPQTWKQTDVPYYGMGIVVLYAPVTIEAGTTFIFEGDLNRRLIVESEGSLAADGTSMNMIRFLGDPATAGTWEGIEVRSDSPNNALEYVEIAHGGRSANYHNVRINGGAVMTISNSIIRDSGTWGVYVENTGQLTESGNTYSNNASGNVRLP